MRPVRTVLALAIAVMALLLPADGARLDPERSRDQRRGGWQADQWNFLPGTGVDAPRAWDNLFAAGRPGGRGVKIAVLDSGVAYANRGRSRSRRTSSRSGSRKGYDFCARTGNGVTACEGRDPYPDDDYGHGTHVASTIAETTNNAHRPDRARLRRDDHPGQGAQRARRGRRGDDRRGHPLRRQAAARRSSTCRSSSASSTTSATQIPLIAAAVRYARSQGRR